MGIYFGVSWLLFLLLELLFASMPEPLLLPFILAIPLSILLALIRVPVKKIISFKGVILVVSIAFLLLFLAASTSHYTGIGGAFYSATGQDEIPNGLPLSFFKPDPNAEAPTGPQGRPALGWQPPLKFYLTPFLIDIGFWIMVAAAIVVGNRYFRKPTKY